MLVWNFNSNLIVKKSCCIAFGARYNDFRTPLQLGAQLLRWNSTVKYLGIVFSAGTSLNVDTDVISRKFYAACNSIYPRTSGLTDLTKLHLMESYCLPLLTYALGALNLTSRQCNSLNVC